MIFCVRLTENWALGPVSWLNVTSSPPSVIIFVKEPLVTVMEHFMVMTPFCYDATLHRRRLFYQSWSAPAVWKSSTSLDRNTGSHSNYSTFSVQLVLHLTCHYVPTYERREDDQQEEVSELHGDGDHFTFPSASS